MSKLYTIQVNVPICHECGGGLKFYQIANHYRCFHCGSLFKVLDFGQSEREFICKKEGKDDSKRVLAKDKIGTS